MLALSLSLSLHLYPLLFIANLHPKAEMLPNRLASLVGPSVEVALGMRAQNCTDKRDKGEDLEGQFGHLTLARRLTPREETNWGVGVLPRGNFSRSGTLDRLAPRWRLETSVSLHLATC